MDTNVLLRSMVRDDAIQALAADKILAQATTVSLGLSALCEFVWVLRRGYGFSKDATLSSVQTLLSISNLIVDRAAAEAGLVALTSGADFADGVIAYEGGCLGGETFASFDRKAVRVLEAHGVSTLLLH